MNAIFFMAAVRWLIWTAAICYGLYWVIANVLPVVETLLQRLAA